MVKIGTTKIYNTVSSYITVKGKRYYRGGIVNKKDRDKLLKSYRKRNIKYRTKKVKSNKGILYIIYTNR